MDLQSAKKLPMGNTCSSSLKMTSFKVYSATLCIVAFLALAHLFSYGSKFRDADRFVDEDNFIAAAQQFFQSGNYTLPGWGDFSPIISTGLLSDFPSGIAAKAGAGLSTIRWVSYSYSLTLMFIVFFLTLTKMSPGQSVFERSLSSVVLLSLFFSYLPYAEGSFRTLGEIPAVSYLLIGLLLIEKGPVSALFLGASVFGGKMVDIAFAGPILAIEIFRVRNSPKLVTKWLLAFFTYSFLWITIIAIKLGPSGAFHWFSQFFDMLHGYGSLASGANSDVSKLSLIQRLSDPRLEWVGYPRILKIKIILLLLLPLLWLVVKRLKPWLFENIQQPISERFVWALIVGQFIFGVWYFCFHPYMWLRHLQPAFIIGLMCLFWAGISMAGRTWHLYFLADK